MRGWGVYLEPGDAHVEAVRGFLVEWLERFRCEDCAGTLPAVHRFVDEHGPELVAAVLEGDVRVRT
jgi:hypothetical protein